MRGIVEASISDAGWTTGTGDNAGNFTEPINDVLFDMGLTAVSQITADRIEEARLRARASVWLAVTEHKVPLYDAGGMSRTLERSQVFAQAFRMLARAEARLSEWERNQTLNTVGGIPLSGSARVRTVWGADDPYNIDD